MTKIIVEWRDGDMWRQSKTEMKISRKGNAFFRHGDDIYVVEGDWRLDSKILKKADGVWQPFGRVARSSVGLVAFLGEGESYGEYSERRFQEELAAGKYPRLVFGQKT